MTQSFIPDLVDIELDEPQIQETIQKAQIIKPSKEEDVILRLEILGISIFRGDLKNLAVYFAISVGITVIMIIAIFIPPIMLRENIKNSEIKHRSHVVDIDNPSTMGFHEDGLLICGSSIIRDTHDATSYQISSCGDVLVPDGKMMRGNWYGFIGTGSCITISTCNIGTNFDTTIRIFEGNLRILGEHSCVKGNDDARNECYIDDDLSIASLITKHNVFYSVFVGGFDSQVGQYNITMECGDCLPSI